MNQKGRPTKYSEEYLDKVQEYLANCGNEIEEWHKTRGEKSDTFQRIVKPKLPTVEGLAKHIGVARSTIYEWEKTYPEFSDSLETLLSMQKEMLLEGGLSGEYNPMIAKLVLSANHNMVERKDHTTGGRRIMIAFDDSFTPETEGNS